MNLSLVIPVYNERENLPLLFDALYAVMNTIQKSWEVIFVDDGSHDKSLSVLKEYAEKDPEHIGLLLRQTEPLRSIRRHTIRADQVQLLALFTMNTLT